MQDFFPVSPTLRVDLLGLPGTLRVMANVVRFPAIESHDNLFLRKSHDVNTLREPAFVLPYPSQPGNAQLTVMGRGRVSAVSDRDVGLEVAVVFCRIVVMAFVVHFAFLQCRSNWAQKLN